MKKVLLLLTLAFVVWTSVAQNQRLFYTISVENGMPHSEINAIATDSTGYLWFGTYNGIARYDGYSLYVTTKDAASRPNKSLRVLSLFYDNRSGFLLIGTEGDGMKVMDLESYEICEQYTFANSIYAIKRGADDSIWVGTERGIVKCTLSDGNYRFKYCESSLSKVSDIIQIDDHTLLATSSEGTHLVDTFSGDSSRLLKSFSRALLRITENEFLIGTSVGLFRWSSSVNKAPTQIDRSDVSCIRRTKYGTYWIGTMDTGIVRYNEDFSSAIQYRLSENDDGKGLPDNGIHSFGEDFSGNLWIGTQNGVCKYFDKAESFEFYSELLDKDNRGSIISNKTSTFYEDQYHRIWIGKYHSGLKILDRATKTIYSIRESQSPELFNSTISSFFRDRQGNVWVGTWNGLYVVPARYVENIDSTKRISLVNMGEKFSMRGATFFKITDDRSGNLWFSTDSGLYRYHPSEQNYFDGELTRFLAPTVTTDIYIEYGDNDTQIIWVGTQHGLQKLVLSNAGTKTAILLSHNSMETDSLYGEFVSSIYCDTSDRLWILGIDGYINQVTGNRLNNMPPTFKSLDINCSGEADTAESIQEDNSGNLWIGGVRMIRFDPEDWSLKYYDSSNGLQNRSFKIWSSYRLSSGELVFGGINGFSIFNPENIKPSVDAPKIVLEDLYISGRKISVGEEVDNRVVLSKNLNLTDKIVLPYNCNNLSISFAALHFTSPNKNITKYILEGHDNIWTELKGNNRSASYTNLSPGTYVFRLKGCNCDSVWSGSEKKLVIKITPPFWASVPAYFLYVILVSAFAYYLWRTVKQHEKNKKETQLYEMKLKYFADISHEIKTPLSLISAPVTEISQLPDLDANIQRKLALVRKNLIRLMDLVEQIIDFNRYESKVMKLKLSEQNIVSVCRICMSYFEDKAESKDIDFGFETDAPQINAVIDREKIEKVLFNIISNALKFTPVGGRIVIACKSGKSEVTISITDNGTGIRADEYAKVFNRFYSGDKSSGGSGIGLALAKAIIEQHKGRIWVDSVYGQGASFHFTIPLGSDHFSPEELSTLSDDNKSEHFYSTIRGDELDNDTLLNGIYSGEGNSSAILVVEDNDDMRVYLSEILGKHYAVSVAENGMNAYEMAVGNNYDCIVTDVMMPLMDGFELCSKIKNNIQTSHIPVLLLTAKDTVEDKITASNTGADDFIPKPFDVTLLIARINNLIKQRNEFKRRFNTELEYSPSMATITPIDQQFMESCLNLIEKNIGDSAYNVEQLCKALSMSRPTVYKKIKSLTGLSVVAFIRSIRLKRAAQLLKQDSSSIKNIMYMVGFDNTSYFSARFKKEFGCTPNEYIEKPAVDHSDHNQEKC